MCLAYPMQIITKDGMHARCRAKGVERDVNLMLISHVKPRVGDFILVHVGSAIAKLEADEANSIWSLLEQALDVTGQEMGERRNRIE